MLRRKQAESPAKCSQMYEVRPPLYVAVRTTGQDRRFEALPALARALLCHHPVNDDAEDALPPLLDIWVRRLRHMLARRLARRPDTAHGEQGPAWRQLSRSIWP